MLLVEAYRTSNDAMDSTPAMEVLEGGLERVSCHIISYPVISYHGILYQ